MARTTKPAKKKRQTLEGLVNDGRPSRVCVLSEVGYDTDYFNDKAYDALLDFMQRDPEISGVLVDGALTRLDRPEYLNDVLTYWSKSEEFCTEEMDRIKNRDQYDHMMCTQMSILETRLAELRKKLPDAKLVLSIDSEDIQYTVSAVMNEMLLREKQDLADNIASKKGDVKTVKSKKKEYQKRYNSIKETEGAARDRSTVKRKIDSCDRKLERAHASIEDLEDKANLFRVKKVRPMAQFLTQKFVTELYARYERVCEGAGATLVTNPSILQFGDLTVDYAHSRHSTWGVLKRREHGLLYSTHGKMTQYQEKVMQELGEAARDGVDVILESGHAGIGFKQFQKVRDSVEETNFKNQSSYDPDAGEEFITIVSALPFEDQAKISEFIRGKKTVRMSGGKPIGTRKIAAIDRQNNDSVSGLTIIAKDAAGLVNTEWIQYQNFKDGSALRQPESYSMICASSDEHKGSPEEDNMAQDGLVALYNFLLDNAVKFRGKKAKAAGYINGGDAGEANSKKWNHRYHDKRDPHILLRENLDDLLALDPSDKDAVMELAMKITNDAMGGSVESMSVILERVADYYDRFLVPTLEKSDLKHAHTAVPGNHSDDVLRDVGMRETDTFVVRAKARGTGVYEVGKPDYHKKDAGSERVYIGGYSNARIINIPDYGMGADGKPKFGPVNVVVQHDPKGSGGKGLVGEGKNVGADLALAGHTHENYLKVYKTGDNTFSVGYRLATMQGVSPTEKYYASSVPRTQAAHLITMPMPGDFSEKALPAGYLRRIGRQVLEDAVEQGLKKKR
ncbi:MAG: hypothetical protein V1729_04620 [Candidatus Woesearchaeota archaeon]